ncbi:MAG TPA: EAL domain-containing protein [Azospira sp.]|nr:EAL domain-containing protein [Azospira sp.]
MPPVAAGARGRIVNRPPLAVLLVEDDPADARQIRDALAAAGGAAFTVDWVTRLDAALARLRAAAPADAAGGAGPDEKPATAPAATPDASDASETAASAGEPAAAVGIVLLDLTLPDGRGLAALDQVRAAAPAAVILVLAGVLDEGTARMAIQRGADDYLIKGHADPHWLPRALRYLIERKAAEVVMQASEARFRAMSDASPLGIFVSDRDGACVYSNAAYQKISGLDYEHTLGTNWSTAIHPEDRQRVLAEWRAAAQGRLPFNAEVRFLRTDGSIVWARLNAAAMRAGGEPQGYVQTVEDITDRKATERVLQIAEDALFEAKERAQVTLDSIGDAVLSTDLAGNVTYLNLMAETMTGWSREEAMGLPLTEVFNLVDGATHEPAVNPAQRAIDEDRTVGLAMDTVLIRRDGVEAAIEDSAAPIHNRDGKVAGAVLVFHDVSVSRAMTLQMSHLARHDFLTGLPNRVLLTERLAQSIGLARRHRKQVGLFFLDLDYFKHINDSLGHRIGDELLRSVAIRLVDCVRTTDTVCRQGGDEFVILLAEIEHPQDAAHIAEKLIAAFATPHRVDGHELHVTPSIGLAIYPDDGNDAETVMKNADIAMYHAKAAGRNNYQFFREEMNSSAVRRQSVENGLRRALQAGEFLLHYQPKIDVASGAMTGAEALIRWQDPEHGLIYPDEFVPIAEECGLIVPIGRWVLNEACRQLRAWQDAGLLAVPVAVNVSALEFRHPDFIAGLDRALAETGVAPRYLELELTESVLMHDAESSAEVLAALRARAVLVGIDDFGTGYSSLSYLQRFATDTLKIDKSFVRDIVDDEGDATIVTAVICMGKNLKQRVVAEGVETPAQLDFLRSQACDEAQGFHFSHPLPAEDFARLLAAGDGAAQSLPAVAV